MLHKKASDRVWKLLIDELRKRVDGGKSLNSVAIELGLSQSTVDSWLKQVRGARASLEKTVEALRAMGVPMSKIIEAMSNEEAGAIIEAYEKEPDLFKQIVNILSNNPHLIEKLRSEVNFLSNMTDS